MKSRAISDTGIQITDFSRDEPGMESDITTDDFLAYMPSHSYIFTPTGEMWAAASVNAKVGEIGGVKAHAWLDRNRPVEQMTWYPGEPPLIEGRLISNGGWIERANVAVFNLYRPSTIRLGDPAKSGPWVDHVRKVFPNEWGHIIAWFAHRVQHPGDKINHALVLGGTQGIGKDTMLEPVKRAIGHWNFSEVSPQQLLARFNGFLKAVILRVSEARDLGEMDRFSFYDHMKAYTAAPPDMLLCDEKHIRAYHIPNVVGVIITTNHKSDGIYLPSDDRRHFVAWSEATKEDFPDEYWTRLWRWYERGGYEHVAAYLAQYDLSGFNAKAPPPKTAAFWDIVDANVSPENAPLMDAIDHLGKPDALTSNDLLQWADDYLRELLTERKHRPRLPHRLGEVGYEKERQPGVKDGMWVIKGKRHYIYVRKELSQRDKASAAFKYFHDRNI